MKARLTLKPGQKGTKRLTDLYGDRLFCVRYRYDEKAKKKFKTVELIVEEHDWEPLESEPHGFDLSDEAFYDAVIVDHTIITFH